METRDVTGEWPRDRRLEILQMWTINRQIRELLGLSMLAAIGCGLAWACDDAIFAMVFSMAAAFAFAEAICRHDGQ
jgi:hypothetical protein